MTKVRYGCNFHGLNSWDFVATLIRHADIQLTPYSKVIDLYQAVTVCANVPQILNINNADGNRTSFDISMTHTIYRIRITFFFYLHLGSAFDSSFQNNFVAYLHRFWQCSQKRHNCHFRFDRMCRYTLLTISRKRFVLTFSEIQSIQPRFSSFTTNTHHTTITQKLT